METLGRKEGSARRRLSAAAQADVFVFGLSFWNATYPELRAWWEGVLRDEARAGVVLAFANANTLNHAIKDPFFRESLGGADVRINDGIGFRIASRMRGVETRANLNGTDLLPRLFQDADREVTVFVYGATEESNAEAAAALERRFPKVTVAGRLNGFVDQDEAEATIRTANADVVLVALGHPLQEDFCVRRRDFLQSKLLVPVGGLVDFLSETKPRAPKILRKVGLEWIYRLMIEPKRMFARYVVGNPLFLARSVAHARRDRELFLQDR